MIDGGADLHIHSCYSDGLYTPLQIIQLAIEKGIRAISISDHDTVQGVEETLDLASQMDIMAIPATEISTIVGNREVHILGYHFDWRNAQLNKRLDWLCRRWKTHHRDECRYLSQSGFEPFGEPAALFLGKATLIFY